MKQNNEMHYRKQIRIVEIKTGCYKIPFTSKCLPFKQQNTNIRGLMIFRIIQELMVKDVFKTIVCQNGINIMLYRDSE